MHGPALLCLGDIVLRVPKGSGGLPGFWRGQSVVVEFLV